MSSRGIARIDLDPLGGVAGDMFAAALADAFPEHLPRVERDLASATVPKGVRAHVEESRNAGFRGARFVVEQDTDARPPRTLAAMQRFLAEGMLEQPVCRHALAIFTHLAEAEAHVHGASVDSVHFHEVSDWDSVVDVVAAASLIHSLDSRCWRVGPLPLGGGTVRTAHGDIPVPAPATAEILKGFRWVDDGTSGERVTPTGAAILKHLCREQDTGTAADPGILERIGIGCGTRTLNGRANILRAMVFAEADRAPGRDMVELLSFEVDDMSGEELAVALEHLRATPGVLDVVQIPMLGKKGRSTVGVRLMIAPDRLEGVVDACFLQTSTLGLRHQQVLRRVLPRESVHITLAGAHPVSGKRATRPGQQVSVKVDSDALTCMDTLEERRSLTRRALRRLVAEEPDD